MHDLFVIHRETFYDFVFGSRCELFVEKKNWLNIVTTCLYLNLKNRTRSLSTLMAVDVNTVTPKKNIVGYINNLFDVIQNNYVGVARISVKK